MKRCSTCQEWKDKSEFYKNRSNKDGLTYACADCMRQKTFEYAQTERGKAIKKKYNTSDVAREKKDRWQKSKRGRQKRKENQRKHDLHIKARRKVSNAIRDGRIPHVNTIPCANCGGYAQEYHHFDYSPENWLNVIALCFPCHRVVDKEICQ